ncbi:MAG: DUF6089 family protein [Bacteroidales bacterium]
MKNIVIAFFPLFWAAVQLSAQDKIAAGGFASMAYYLGDFNHDTPFLTPGPYVGGTVTYSLTDYYSLRVNLGGGQLKGSPSNYIGKLQANTPGQTPADFNSMFFDADVRFELGFLPYDPFLVDRRTRSFSPYYSIGAGVTYQSSNPFFQIPMTFGVKYRLFYRLTATLEWTFRKTFSDRLDNWENIRVSSSTINNNDWISFIGISLIYNLSDKADCPAFK